MTFFSNNIIPPKWFLDNSNNKEFDQYLKRFGYKFVNENKEYAGYAILKKKNIALIMDIGSSPVKKFSKGQRWVKN